MLATLVQDKLTPLTPREATSALRTAFRRLAGHDPTAQQLAVLVAQTALETGNWKSLHWNNFGNAKAGPQYEGFYTQFRCNEVIKGETIWFDPPDPQCNFRAHETAADGAFAHIKFLKKTQYAKAWTYLVAGDARGFVCALKQAMYFTALLEPYVRAVVSLYRKYLPVCAAELTKTDAEPATLAPQDEEQLAKDMQQSAQIEIQLIDLSQTWQPGVTAARDAAIRELE